MRTLHLINRKENLFEALKLFPNITSLELVTKITVKNFFAEIQEQQFVMGKVENLRLAAQDNHDIHMGYISDGLLSKLTCSFSKLVKLEINELKICGNSCDHLYNLCSGFSSTLRSLGLGLMLESYEGEVFIKFPELKLLDQLSLTLPYDAQTGRKFGDLKFVPIISPGFGAKTFPRLQVLKLVVESEYMDGDAFLKANFGIEEKFINEAVRTFCFATVISYERELLSELAEEKFRQSFPNIVNRIFKLM